ncbi:MAG TPA: hypothetical protein VK106_03900 [Balneolaceae bacterium]|nr:hypothetical protein [Balneolaceae bacterium]
MAKKILLAFLLFLFFISKISVAQQANASAERPVGVKWPCPATKTEAAEQLEYFSSIGIQYLQIDCKLPTEIWNLISKHNFQVYAQLPIKFPITPTFEKSDSAFAEGLQRLIKHYTSHHAVKAVGIFEYGPVQEPAFQQAVFHFLSSLKSETARPLYYVTSRPGSFAIDSLFDFKILHSKLPNLSVKNGSFIGAYYISVDAESQQALSTVEKTLAAVHKKEAQIPVFYEADLILNLAKKFPGFKKTLSLYTHTADYPLAVEKSETVKQGNQGSLITILLLISWIILAVTYYVSPVFRNSMTRYFTGHQFYIKDVYERHLRSVLPGASILFQQVILTGIVFFCISNVFISPLGKEALLYHYPVLSIFGETGYALLFWGFAAAVVFEILCLSWLLVTNPRLKYFSQVFNLYPWPLQLNLLIVTIMVTIYSSGENEMLLFITGLVFLIITLAAFIIAAVDAINLSKSQKRLWVAASSLLLYIVLLTGSIIWIYFSPYLLKVAKLALYL